MACTFCEVASGERPAHIVDEDDDTIAFLDHRPVFHGHVLIVPKLHFETLADLPAEVVTALFRTAQRVARAVEIGLDADGSFVAMNNRVSQSVPHAHVHVIPRRRKDGLRGFFWPRQAYDSEEHALSVQAAIRGAIARRPSE